MGWAGEYWDAGETYTLKIKIIAPKRKKEFIMKLVYEPATIQGMNGNVLEVCVEATAKTDDETKEIMKRTLRYGVDTGQPDWENILLAALRLQKDTFLKMQKLSVIKWIR